MKVYGSLERAQIENVGVLPTAGIRGRVVLLTADNKYYYDNGTSYKELIDSDTVQALSNKTSLGLKHASGANNISLSAPAAAVSYGITLPAAAPTANTALAYDGANYVWSSAGGWTPRAEQNVTSNGTLTASTTVGQEIIYVRGVSNTNVSVSALGPFASGAWNDGITKRIVGLQDDATVTIIHSDTVDGVILNGDCTLARYDVLELQYDANNSIWFEVSRSIK